MLRVANNTSEWQMTPKLIVVYNSHKREFRQTINDEEEQWCEERIWQNQLYDNSNIRILQFPSESFHQNSFHPMLLLHIYSLIIK